MANREQDRGYGSLSGRYAENRDYDAGHGYRARGRDEDRGWFERAGDEVRSWFGDGYDRERGYRNVPPGRAYADRDVREPWGGGDWVGYGSGYRRSRFDAPSPHDENYSAWRQEQIDALDRDYAEYRRENRDRFHDEFSTWRARRQDQRSSMRQVSEHMDVIGLDGAHIGTVDKVVGDRIILTRSDPSAGGHHHSIPCGWIERVDDKVTINRTAEQAHRQWRDEENRRALFESEESRSSAGPRVLGRSFAGTYETR